MKVLYKFYVRKYQSVTAFNAAQQSTLREACYNNQGELSSFLYFPLVVRHNLYDTERIREICRVYTFASPEHVIDLGGLSVEKVNAVIAKKVYLTLERDVPKLDAQGMPVTVPGPTGGGEQIVYAKLRRRFGLWFSSYECAGETVANELATIPEVRFQEDDGETHSWRVLNVYLRSSVLRFRAAG